MGNLFTAPTDLPISGSQLNSKLDKRALTDTIDKQTLTLYHNSLLIMLALTLANSGLHYLTIILPGPTIILPR